MTFDQMHGPSATRVAVLGAGSWGTTFAKVLADAATASGVERDIRLWGRRVDADETDALLTPYGQWAGLASVYLLAGYASGTVRLRHEDRDTRGRPDRRVPDRRAA